MEPSQSKPAWTHETDVNGNTIEIRKYIVSQYRIEYNADRIYRVDHRVIVAGPAEGQCQVHLLDSQIVNSAVRVAKEEGRVFINIEDAFPHD